MTEQPQQTNITQFIDESIEALSLKTADEIELALQLRNIISILSKYRTMWRNIDHQTFTKLTELELASLTCLNSNRITFIGSLAKYVFTRVNWVDCFRFIIVPNPATSFNKNNTAQSDRNSFKNSIKIICDILASKLNTFSEEIGLDNRVAGD